MRLKIRTHNDTIDEARKTTLIISTIDEIVSTNCPILKNYWIVAVNNIDYWYYGDYSGLFSMMYEVR